MGEAAKNEGEKKVVAGGEKKPEDGNVTVVLKVDLHCEGCAKKVKRAVKNFGGVSNVTTDFNSNKVTVIGKVDPSAVREKLQQKTKKKVDLISPLPAAKKEEKPAEKKPEEKKPEEKKTEEKKPEEKKPAEPKKPVQSTVVLKIRLHCDGCISKIRKAVMKIKGVDGVEVDKEKNLVIVKGTMDAKELAPTLSKKINKSVEVVPPKPAAAAAPAAEKKPDAGGDKKPDSGGDKKPAEKKEAEAKPPAAAPAAASAAKPAGDAAAKMEMSKMMYYGQASTSAPMYWPTSYDGPVSAHNRYVMEAHEHQAFVNQNYAIQGYPNPGHGYGSQMEQYNSTQMFSDENPNAACSIM